MQNLELHYPFLALSELWEISSKLVSFFFHFAHFKNAFFDPKYLRSEKFDSTLGKQCQEEVTSSPLCCECFKNQSLPGLLSVYKVVTDLGFNEVVCCHQPWFEPWPSVCLLLPTDKGYLHKAVAVGTGSHIIEQIQLFEKPEAVQNLLLSPEKVCNWYHEMCG